MGWFAKLLGRAIRSSIFAGGTVSEVFLSKPPRASVVPLEAAKFRLLMPATTKNVGNNTKSPQTMPHDPAASHTVLKDTVVSDPGQGYSTFRPPSPTAEKAQIEVPTAADTASLVHERLEKPSLMAGKELPPLSDEQARILESIKRGLNVFFTGPAGSGKSLLVDHVRNHLEQENIPFAVTAPTGVAALLLGGQTIYSWAGIGKGNYPVRHYLENFRRNVGRFQGLRSTKVLVIDEVSMLPPDIFMKIDMIMRAVKRKNVFMGGMQVIVCGDFYQLPPVIIDAERTCFECGVLVDCRSARKYLLANDDRVLSLNPYLEKLGVSPHDWAICSRQHPRTNNTCGHMWNPTVKYVYQTTAWLEAKFEHFKLTRVYRQKEQAWIDVLAKLKKGEGFEDGKIRAILNSIKRPLPALPSGIKPTILHTHRVSIENENNREYMKLSTTEIQYRALDSGCHVENPGDDDDKAFYRLKPKEFNDELFFKNVAVPETVKLKIGTQVMLLTNLSPKIGLVNGSRGIVTSFKEVSRGEIGDHKKEVLSMLFGNNLKEDFRVLIPRVTFIPPPGALESINFAIYPHIFYQSIRQPAGFYLRLKRVQLPLAWAWATTIHKCQGMSLDYAVINIEKVFLPGQAYVAVSRVRNTSGLQIIGNYDHWEKIFFTDPSVDDFSDYLGQKDERLVLRGTEKLAVEKEREKESRKGGKEDEGA